MRQLSSGEADALLRWMKSQASELALELREAGWEEDSRGLWRQDGQGLGLHLLDAHFTVLRHLQSVTGVKPGIAASVVLDAIRADTGLTMEPYRKALPTPEGTVGNLNAIAVGKQLGVTARVANKMLKAAGYQRKTVDGRGWELTEEGGAYGEMVPFTSGGHSGYQPLWRPDVVRALQDGEGA